MMDKLGKYEIRRELGRGAMGVVYEGYDPMIKRVVAIKTLRADTLAREEAADLLARFRREAQAAGRLNHPNIVAIHDFDEDAGVAFIAMEYVDGRDLRDVFASSERFATKDALRIMEQILDALAYSHAHGVVHRDIKPANVFVREDGTVKVADFGIAHVESSSLTHAGSVMGTPGYMSPEQVLGLPVDGRSDLFSAGVILYQFLTGERPFTGSATTTAQKVLKEEPLPPSTLNVQLPDALDAVVRKALAKKPDERFQSAAEFAAALRSAAGHRMAMPLPAAGAAATDATEVRATAADPMVVPAAPAEPTVARPASADPPKAPAYAARHSQAPAIAIVAGFVVVALAAAAWLWLKRDPAPQPAIAVPATTRSIAAALKPEASPPVPPIAAAPAAAPAEPPAPVPAPGVALPAAAPANAPAPTSPKLEPGTLLITAVGIADPSNPRYQGNAALLQQDLRADANAQLVAKALGLLVDRTSLATHYDALNQRLMTQGASFVGQVVRESAPQDGQDGLVSMTTEAVVDVKAVRRSLNELTRKERIALIRAGGDPRIALTIVVRDADAAGTPPRAAPVAENLLKERIRSFGFRTWSGDGEASRAADFHVAADAKVRRLSTRLEASGITISKYAVTALTVKCIDRATGEEIYFNTTLPKGSGSWPTEEEALRAIGGKVADEFTRDFFLAHVNPTGRRVAFVIDGLPDAATAQRIGRELASLPGVLAARPRAGGAAWDLDLGGSGAPAERVAADVLAPLNRKLGAACFAPGATSGDEVRASFDARCANASVLTRLDTHPPAGLYAAPPARANGVIRNPDTLRKLSV